MLFKKLSILFCACLLTVGTGFLAGCDGDSDSDSVFNDTAGDIPQNMQTGLAAKLEEKTFIIYYDDEETITFEFDKENSNSIPFTAESTDYPGNILNGTYNCNNGEISWEKENNIDFFKQLILVNDNIAVLEDDIFYPEDPEQGLFGEWTQTYSEPGYNYELTFNISSNGKVNYTEKENGEIQESGSFKFKKNNGGLITDQYGDHFYYCRTEMYTASIMTKK